MRSRPGPWALVLALTLLVSGAKGPGARSAAPPFADPPGAVAASHATEFDEVWHDGRAELCGYLLTVERYGKPRRGRAVLITVTEPFSRSRLVKVEDPAREPEDVFEALKVNLVRRFQTGVYDYHTMVSLFTDARTFAPVKVAFTAAEWCGVVHEETTFVEGETRASIASYFEGESARVALPTPEGGVVEDDLFILLRGLREEYLPPGGRRTVPFLAGPFFRRLAHRPLAWSSAVVERRSKSEKAQVPAGSFPTTVYVVTTRDGRVGRFHIEDGPARRVIRWEWTRAGGGADSLEAGAEGTDRGELTGSARLAYWKLHGPGDEAQLRALGLPIPAP